MFNIKAIRPMFTNIVTTCDTYTDDQFAGSLVNVKKRSGSVKEYQKVIAVGTDSRGIQVGDLVMINPQRYAIMKHEKGSLNDGVISDNPVVDYKIPTVELNGVKHLLLDIRDIDFVITDYEDTDETLQGKAANAGLVTPGGLIY